ncbi:sulfotransferase [Shewanella goraebulensis]|uniref:sulfotransferase n=1 Tax=Shewanella goraebulensis TaxID=3050637 RepID=UPI00254BE5D9|nr:sulfotransferase [Shewanella goraebulensis]
MKYQNPEQFQKFKKHLKQWAHQEEIVFVIGSERSGTSLMFQQVCQASNFYDLAEATVETFCFAKPWLLLEKASDENYEMRRYLGDAEQFRTFQQSIIPLVERNLSIDSTVLNYEYDDYKTTNKIWYERRYKHVLRAYFYHVSQNSGLKRLVEKTPAHIRYANRIIEAFPKAKLLVTKRSHAEVIASHRKRYQKEIALGKSASDPSLSWLNKPIEEYINYLNGIDRKINSLLKQYPEQTKVINYNDLSQEPDITLRGIEVFLGENLTSKVAKIARADQAWDPLLNKPPTKNTIDVNNFLTRDELALLFKFN